MSISIRQGTEKDFPALLALVKELALFEKEPDGVKNTVEQMQREKDFFKFFVAEDDGAVVGIVVYFFTYSTWVGKSLYVDDLFVKESYRGRKIGTTLLNEIFKVAQDAGCGRLRWQVNNWNADAIAFYRRLGAKIDETWFNCDFDAAAIARCAEHAELTARAPADVI